MGKFRVFLVFLLYQIPFISICSSVPTLIPFQADSLVRGGIESKEKYEICNHSFLSWMCPKTQSNEKTMVVKKQLRDLTTSKPFLQTILPVHVSSSESGETLKVSESKSTPSVLKSGYDRCSHPFHSWLCQKGTKVKNGKGSGTLSSPNKLPSENPNTQSAFIAPEKLPETPKYDKCSHPFHSWLCTKPSQPTPIKMKVPKKPNLVISDSTINVKMKPKKKQYDMCSHAFHSWLCEKSTARPKPKQILSPAPAKPKESITLPVKVKEIEKPHKSKQKSYDKCSHAFHSWLCQYTHKQNIILNYNQPSPSFTTPHYLESKPESNREAAPAPVPLPPPSTTTETISTTTTLTTTTAAPTTVKVPAKYDKCTHSFHSWLCSKPKSPKNSLQLPSESVKQISKEINDSYKPLKQNKQQQNNYLNGNICNHPFHSWLCKNNGYSNPITSMSAQNYNMEQKHTIENTASGKGERTMSYGTSMVKDPYKMTNICSQVFNDHHCQSLMRGKELVSILRSPTAISSNQASSSYIPESSLRKQPSSTSIITKGKLITSKTLKNVNQPPICDNQSHSLLCPQYRNRNLEHTVSLPPNGSTTIQRGRLQIFKQQIHCKHPFHSWICDIENRSKVPKINPKHIPNISSLPLEGEAAF